MPEKLGGKLLSWIPSGYIESTALEQLHNVAALPFIWKVVAVMPDVHWGAGASIGSVIPTTGTVIPAAVGSDLGCGMRAVRTTLKTDELITLDLQNIRESIELVVPTGVGQTNAGNSGWMEFCSNGGWQSKVDERVDRMRHLANAQRDGIHPSIRKGQTNANAFYYDRLAPNWPAQIGSLGSGNHFIEVCGDDTGHIWAFLHSGSRGIGYKLAQRHMKIAKGLMKKWFILDSLPDNDLAYLPIQTPEYNEYMADLRWAVSLAEENRAEIMERVLAVLYAQAGEFERLQTIDTPHNFAQWEHHFGRNVLVTRKGAIEAREGQWGLIPSAMGTGSYVVRGKGCVASLNSGPHGAGRRMSRSAARSKFTMEDFDREVSGVEVRRSESLIDELPGAYKDIYTVLSRSTDLVGIEYRLQPLINVKGD